MIMADVFAWLFIILGLYLVMNSYWIATFALFPAFAERCGDRYRERPWRTLFLGGLVLVPILVIGGALSKAPNPIGAAGKAALLMPVLIGLMGSTGLAHAIGKGLVSPVDATQPWRRVLRGGMVLAFTFLLPFLGWFLVLPGVLVCGFGAAFAARRAPRLPAAAAATGGSALVTDAAAGGSPEADGVHGSPVAS